MTTNDADILVGQYADLSTKHSTHFPALPESLLPAPAPRIIQALKLFIAFHLERGTLTEELRNTACGSLIRLPLYINDEKAQQINQNYSFKLRNARDLLPEDINLQVEKQFAALEWATQAHVKGYVLRCKLHDYADTIKAIGTADPLYWQRVYTLADLEYTLPKKRSFWDRFK